TVQSGRGEGTLHRSPHLSYASGVKHVAERRDQSQVQGSINGERGLFRANGSAKRYAGTFANKCYWSHGYLVDGGGRRYVALIGHRIPAAPSHSATDFKPGQVGHGFDLVGILERAA